MNKEEGVFKGRADVECRGREQQECIVSMY